MRQLGAGEKEKFSPWNTDRFLDQKGAKSVKRRFDVGLFSASVLLSKSTCALSDLTQRPSVRN
jgi:hypothetical protein